ncbi:MAG: DUF1573 domain-containing protein [Thermoguttaceae bacterium]
MRLLAVIVLSFLVGSAIAFTSVEVQNRFAVWYPEQELISKTTVIKSRIKVDPEAKAYVPSDVYDFGVLDRKMEGKCDFTVENKGTKNLLLEVSGTSCTCTGVDVSKKSIPPGDKAIVTVHWNAESSQSTFSQVAVLLTNDPDNPELRFTVKGLYTSPIIINPGTLFFPSIAVGREAQNVARIFGLEKHPLEIKEIKLDDQEHFEVQFEKSELTEEDKKNTVLKSATTVYTVTVKVKPGLPIGSFQERLTIVTNYDSEPTVEYFVKGQIRAGNITIAGKDYARDTGVLNLGKTSVGIPVKSTFTLGFPGSAQADTTVKIVKVEPEALSVEMNKIGGTTEGVAPTFIFKVQALSSTPGYWNGPDQKNMGLIELETNLPDVPTYKMPVQFLIEK